MPTDEEKPESKDLNFEVFMVKTEMYRKNLCGKIDDLKVILGDFAVSLKSLEKSQIEANNNLLKLPCNERKGWYVSMDSRLKLLMWIFIIFTGLTISSLSMAYSSNSQVEIIKNRVTALETYSYGYNDHKAGVNPLEK